MGPRPLELLAPAKNRELGMAAVNHGADAVYIGAEAFGARAAAGNSVADIEGLCAYAHQYGARVYVALNTLVFDSELERAAGLARTLWNAGADALIIQDMAFPEMDLPPIPLFASTQTDNRTPEKVRFLEKNGFQRVILARELGLDAIRSIRAVCGVDLEAFVHGALCVCYSGQCYMSAAIGGRSANRGACGQPCRLPWTLTDGSGSTVAGERHLLSLKDMNRSDHLEEMIRAGITSFKIEGRLKDLAYVKNITAHYRQRLDRIIENAPGFEKASSGKTRFYFSPDPAKTFNRGETDYFLLGRGSGPVHAFNTPKSTGECMGRIKELSSDWLVLDASAEIHNGDGLCFLDRNGRLRGFQVNRADTTGRIFPPGRQAVKRLNLARGDLIYRNHDQAFHKQMAGRTAERRIRLDMTFRETPSGFLLTAVDEDENRAEAVLDIAKEPARNPARALSVIETQLGKLGNTMFHCRRLTLETAPYFLTAKTLNRLRRELAGKIIRQRQKTYTRPSKIPRSDPFPYPESNPDFRLNVANRMAAEFYKKRGIATIAPAFELSPPGTGGTVMVTKHCIRRSLGTCAGVTGRNTALTKHRPLYLDNPKGRFQLVFNCGECEMEVRLLTPARDCKNDAPGRGRGPWYTPHPRSGPL